ncbi:MAG: DUF167 domain-containing protein [Minwuia sp.]|uniref:DUF167 domain-containing protein n=1 Tax=Minwuia sp. TaxID=2493630 RepID=UPI003A859F4F
MTDFVRLDLKVAPGARQDAIEGWIADADGRRRLKVKVTAAPEKGKANKAVIKLIAKRLGVASGAVEVVQGETARLKTLQISGDPAALNSLIAEAFGGDDR